MVKNEWYKSKKLLTTLGGLGFVILTDTFGVPIDAETYWAVVGIIASYVLSQGHVDAKKIEAEAPKTPTVIEAEVVNKEDNKLL